MALNVDTLFPSDSTAILGVRNLLVDKYKCDEITRKMPDWMSKSMLSDDFEEDWMGHFIGDEALACLSVEWKVRHPTPRHAKPTPRH